MTVAANVARARRNVLRAMIDTCAITRPTDPDLATLDEATGNVVPAGAPTSVYTGACALRSTGATDATEGGQSVDVETFRMILPHAAAEVAVGDIVTITASAVSARLVGIVAEVTDLLTDDTLAPFRMFGLRRLVPAEPPA